VLWWYKQLARRVFPRKQRNNQSAAHSGGLWRRSHTFLDGGAGNLGCGSTVLVCGQSIYANTTRFFLTFSTKLFWSWSQTLLDVGTRVKNLDAGAGAWNLSTGSTALPRGKCSRFGVGRSGVRLLTGFHHELADWYWSLLTRRTMCGRAAGTI